MNLQPYDPLSMTDATPSFPPMDFTRFQWRASADDPSLFVREAAGGEVIEDIWHRLNHGEQTLFLGLDITLAAPLPPDAFLAHARAAWTALRFAVPLVACQTAHDAAGNTLITYRQAQSSADADAWAQRTLRLAHTPDLDQLRYELGQNPIPEENGDQTFIHVLPRASHASYGLLLHTSHVPFDGAGIKIFMNRFLALLAPLLASPSPPLPALQWGTESANLTPCAYEVLGPDEERDGARYAQTLAGVMGDLASAMPRQHGFRSRNTQERSFGPGPTRRLAHTFSAAQTAQILGAARTHGLTLNHIAHAAVTMLAARDNPPSPSTPPDAAFVYYGLRDSRDRLAPPYGSRGAYPGYCLGVSAIQIPLAVFASSSGGSKDLLLEVARVVKDEYSKQKAYPCLLAIGAQQVEMMLSGVKSGAPPPPPWMGPWYSGDGIGETYLDPVHNDSNGQPALHVDDFFVSLNKTDPGPFFRATSWKGRLMLSVDTNERNMPVEVVRGFVDAWVEILLGLAV